MKFLFQVETNWIKHTLEAKASFTKKGIYFLHICASLIQAYIKMEHSVRIW